MKNPFLEFTKRAAPENQAGQMNANPYLAQAILGAPLGMSLYLLHQLIRNRKVRLSELLASAAGGSALANVPLVFQDVKGGPNLVKYPDENEIKVIESPKKPEPVSPPKVNLTPEQDSDLMPGIIPGGVEIEGEIHPVGPIKRPRVPRTEAAGDNEKPSPGVGPRKPAPRDADQAAIPKPLPLEETPREEFIPRELEEKREEEKGERFPGGLPRPDELQRPRGKGIGEDVRRIVSDVFDKVKDLVEKLPKGKPPEREIPPEIPKPEDKEPLPPPVPPKRRGVSPIDLGERELAGEAHPVGPGARPGKEVPLVEKEEPPREAERPRGKAIQPWEVEKFIKDLSDLRREIASGEFFKDILGLRDVAPPPRELKPLPNTIASILGGVGAADRELARERGLGGIIGGAAHIPPPPLPPPETETEAPARAEDTEEKWVWLRNQYGQQYGFRESDLKEFDVIFDAYGRPHLVQKGTTSAPLIYYEPPRRRGILGRIFRR